MRILFEIFGQTLQTLWAHKLRSFLTMFGIAWGVGSLLLLVGLGEGFRSGNKKQFDELGENVMFIWDGRAPAVNGSFTSMQKYYLTSQDAKDVLANCRDVKAAAPVISRNDVRAVSEFFQSSGQLMGVTPNFNKIRYLPIADGRWIDEMDDTQKRAVLVLGDEARRLLFPGRPSVGSTVLLNGVRFQVIGTLKRIGHGNNNDLNLRLFMPFNTMHEDFPPLNVGEIKDAISFLNYQPTFRDLHENAKVEVHKVIARNHGFDYLDLDAFDEWDSIRTSDQVGKIFDAMNVFLGSVGLVTLSLGAIGIINIMLVAVADRTREIGLRKALGATNRSIMFQFFIEGAFLTVVSGLLGMAAAAGFMAALGRLPAPPGFDPPQLVPSTAALAIVSLAIAGVIAGLYPARKAAILAPVDALRKE
ncbi:MAG: transporter substrate-binding protein [Acidobacteriaceae bacterium]|nr:transporter substrate-binding protein [Acidobacteriaceae bacterium]